MPVRFRFFLFRLVSFAMYFVVPLLWCLGVAAIGLTLSRVWLHWP